ncbi:hypothetical protein HN51_025661 [Arachis hypogaea]
MWRSLSQGRLFCLEYYPYLVRTIYSNLNYVVPKSDREDEEVMLLIEFDLGLQNYRVTME